MTLLKIGCHGDYYYLMLKFEKLFDSITMATKTRKPNDLTFKLDNMQASAAENDSKWKFAQCFGDKGESDDITEGKTEM